VWSTTVDAVRYAESKGLRRYLSLNYERFWRQYLVEEPSELKNKDSIITLAPPSTTLDTGESG
jgi:hypothetical protein